MIVMDTSGSIRRKRFEAYFLQFAKNIVKDMDIDAGDCRVGLVSFSTSEAIQFHLNTYQSKAVRYIFLILFI